MLSCPLLADTLLIFWLPSPGFGPLYWGRAMEVPYLLGLLMLLEVDKAEASGLAIVVSHHLHTLHLS